MKIFSKQEITRQDFIDNEIFCLIQKLFPTKKLVWNIETIGAVRDVILNHAIRSNSIEEIKFYP